MKKLFSFLFLIAALNLFSQENYLLIGTYTSGKSEGIYVYKFNSQNGDSKFISAAKTSNPSFLAISPNQKFVYAANEDDPGKVSSYSFNKATGTLTELNQQSSLGKNPCYLTVDKTGKWVITGNYTSANIAVHPVNANGSLGNAVDSVLHEGSSVVEGRQDEAHVHATFLSPDNKTLYVPDLGMDKVMLYKFSNKTGKLTEADMPYIITEPGAGPRHFDIHPNGKFGYLMQELSGVISVFEIYKDGSMESIQDISGLPREYDGPMGSADIHVSPDGKFLYCSNRGESNTIGILKINQQTGMLAWVGDQSTMGKTPRNFNFDPTGNFLLAANQNSDEIVIFKRNKETGLLTDTGKRINVPNPVCIKWVSTK